MKILLKILVGVLFLAVGFMSYQQIQARWEMEERIARIDQRIAERIARLDAERARRNLIADKLHQSALQNERDAAARWDAAKARGKLPGNNTAPSPPAGNSTVRR